MSRIDEAFKRAGRSDRSGYVTATGAVDDQSAYTVDRSIQRYVAEKRTEPLPAEPHRRPSTVEATPTALRQLAGLAPWIHDKTVLSREMTNASSEQYRRLAAALHDLQLERNVKTLMVSSAVPQEGKTLTITNLALTLSDAYDRRVLLIDADLRRPAVHDAFGIPNRTGLADVVRSQDESLTLIEVSPRLTVVTAGSLSTDAPMAELTSDRFPLVIKQASAAFDWVLIDTPPAGLLPDAQLVARVADAILFVIGAGSTPYPIVQRALAALGDRVIGTVLNRVDESRLTVADYYKGYYTASPRK